MKNWRCMRNNYSTLTRPAKVLVCGSKWSHRPGDPNAASIKCRRNHHRCRCGGLMCALTATQRGRSVLLLDHSEKLAEKIRISGGGRCNFTNINTKPDNFLSQNPHFCRSALARFTPQHFIELLDKHGISYHEKRWANCFATQVPKRSSRC